MIQELFAFAERIVWFFAVLLLMFLMWRVSNTRRSILKKWNLHRNDAPAFSNPVNRTLKNILFFVGLTATIVALMGPQWGQKEQSVKTEGLDLCIAIDLSRSMLAEDISPNRLDQAKNQLTAFLPKLAGDRVTLVAFAGSSYIVSPLTSDYSALINYLIPLDPSFISNQATSLDSAIMSCLKGLGITPEATAESLEWESSKLIALVTDGESTSDTRGVALKKVEDLGIPVFSIAVGTKQGAKIPVRDERGQLKGYVMDSSTNQAAITKLYDESLINLAKSSKGQVFYAESGLAAWQNFYEATKNFKRSSQEAGSKFSKEHRFQIPLFIAFMLLLWDLFLTETKFPWHVFAFWRRRS